MRSGNPVGLIMLDLDDFKEVNDTRGHAAGDEILCWAVEVMEETVRPMDTIGRVGGDEFAVIVPGAGPEDSGTVAGRILRGLEARAPASAGIAVFPADGADRDELQRSADAKLYAGKRGSRTRETGQDDREGAQLGDRAGPRGRRAHGGPARALVEGGRVRGRDRGRLGWRERDLEMLQMAAILHDVGKVSIPDHVLRKPQPLNEREWETIKQNPVRGAEMASRIQGLETIVPWIRHSLERLDGSGYPDGLSGDDIPLACRILHVADAYDAMRCERPYRPAMSDQEARGELARGAGTQFDPPLRRDVRRVPDRARATEATAYETA